MAQLPKDVEEGDFIRMRKHIPAAFIGAQQQARQELKLLREVAGNKSSDAIQLQYIYLKVLEITREKLGGTDLKTMKPAKFEIATGLSGKEREVEYEFWGFDEIVKISKQEAREIIVNQQSELEMKLAQATNASQKFRHAAQRVMG